MAYVNISNKDMKYNGNIYHHGQAIPDFGVGKYDDLLLQARTVGSTGEGNGNEDKIANQKEARTSFWKAFDSEQRDEDNFLSDVKKYQAEKDLVLDPELSRI